jgi:hypothetical protein
MKTFPILYKKTSTGKIQQWETSVSDDSVITTRFGQVDGKIQETQEVITKGKNIGKANETTPYDQAVAQAQANWTKQLKKGYVDSIEDAMAGKTDNIIEGGISPMLAHVFSKQGHKITYPALAQPKLDGCVDGDTLISTNIGEITISDIVINRIDCMVYSYNEETKKGEYKRIANRFFNGVDEKEPNPEWYEIEFEDGRKLKITGNHPVYLPKLKCWRRVDELKPDDLTLKYF